MEEAGGWEAQRSAATDTLVRLRATALLLSAPPAVQLRGCLRLMEENEAAIQAALKSDVGKPGFEATFTEIVPVQVEIRQMLDEIDHWMRPQSCPTPAALLPGSSYIMRDPYGVVLIVAPFNYPIQLTMLPLIAAISAGNCAILKPSELTPASTALLLELLPKYLDTSAFQIVTGGVAETTALLKEKVSEHDDANLWACAPER